MDFEDLSDSIHAQELEKGLSRPHFSRALESQYTAAHLQRVRLTVRVWSAIGLAISLLYTVVQALRTGIFSGRLLINVLIIVPCAAALVWLSWKRSHYERYYMRIAPALVTAKGMFAAYFVAQLVGKAEDEQIGILV